MSFRFTSPELLQLNPPPKLASQPFDTLLQTSLAKVAAEMAEAGIAWDVATLNANPGVRLTRTAIYRDVLRRQQMDEAVAQTFLGYATDAMLDQRAADYGVLRRVVVFANPITGTAEVLEDDESLRLRARLAWEAQSVAGPQGAYIFHALDAHPGVFAASAIGPETGIVQPGEVLVVVQGRDGNGVPTPGMIDAVADRLDAYEVIYADGTSYLQPGRDEQSVRPLGARVTVAGARPLIYTTTATLYVDANGDREVIRIAALANLQAYQESRRRVGVEVPRSGRIAALHLIDSNGIPLVDEVEIAEGDVLPSHMEIPVPGEITLNLVPR